MTRGDGEGEASAEGVPREGPGRTDRAEGRSREHGVDDGVEVGVGEGSRRVRRDVVFSECDARCAAALTMISKRVFQAIALATLPLPFAATWAAWSHLPRFAEESALAGAVRLLLGALTLLVCVIVWAVALLPLRQRTELPPLTSGLSDLSAASLGAAYEKARLDHQADAASTSPASRRRYHLRMAGAGAVIAVVTGAVSAAMLSEPSGRVLLWFPVASVVSAVLALYHLARGLFTVER